MIILQKIIENMRENFNIPQEWLYPNLGKFGLDWELFPYQQRALENITAALYLLYKNFKQNGGLNMDETRWELLKLYRERGLSQKLNDDLDIKEDDENFKFLSGYFPAGTRISFKSFINRAAFWMATGSGKTLVIVKLLAVLARLMNKNLIPQRDILILAPKDEILSQIKEHINKFNKGAEITVNLRNLKEWERIKNQQSVFSKTEINVFYYRADNIADKKAVSKKGNGARINYESIYNGGNWYLILDEAHKGEKETSKGQQYFMALTKNGFLFNFSATFTDELDIATTVFDYKLDTFLKEGYGKKPYIAGAGFKIKGDDFSDNEKKDIIAETLIIFALAKGHFHKMQQISKRLYHAPLLVTLANTVNVEEADLKIFYKFLAGIARGKFNFEAAKNNLKTKLEANRNYLFGLGEVGQEFISGVEKLKKKDFFRAVFNAETEGNIEIAEFKGNSREIAFKLVNAKKYFMVAVASDIIKWEDNVLEGYEKGRAIEESFFADINKRNDVNILLGSRIFAEGWDTNRPNVINFINIGVSSEAQKFVLQSIGRGVRIEPIPHRRKRFGCLEKGIFSTSEAKTIEAENNLLESLFVFATKKEVVENILRGLEKQAAPEWIALQGIKKNEKIDEGKLPVFIPRFEDGGMNDNPFWIGRNEYSELFQFAAKNGPKVLLLNQGVKLRTFNKIQDESNFDRGDRRRKKSNENILSIVDNYFNENAKKLAEIKILDGEISHYQQVKTNIHEDEIGKLEEDISKILAPKLSDEQMKKMLEEGKISMDEFIKLVKEQAGKEHLQVLGGYLVNYKPLAEHYYTPILYKQDSDQFQHIIKKQSEIDFLCDLQGYLTQADNLLKGFDWWYFSKIDEKTDKIFIPYFNSERGQYDNFYPDFIFWLKKENKYYIKFIDPHGIEYARNSAEKIDGFLSFVEDLNQLGNKKVEKVDFYYFNERQPGGEVKEEYRKFWTKNFSKIFGI